MRSYVLQLSGNVISEFGKNVMEENVVKSTPASAEPSVETRTVLVVEDDVLIRLMVADRLRACCFDVVEACSAEEAVTLLQSEVPIDLVFTDVQMPGPMDGMALAKLVRETRPEMKVIVASGNLPAGGRAQPTDAFFRKPYDLDRLATRIEELLADGHL
jgi:CheY-like chemotaxis protein